MLLGVIDVEFIVAKSESEVYLQGVETRYMFYPQRELWGR